MVKTEIFTCDGCGDIIDDEPSMIPETTRFWQCRPRFRKSSEMVSLVLTFPDEPKDYCVKCFDKMKKVLKIEE